MRSPHRIRRWLTAIGLGLVLLAALAVVVLRLLFAGPALASEVADMLNDKMRGRIQIGSIDWSLRDLPTIARGGWVPIELRNVTVWDAHPERQIGDQMVVDLAAPRAKLLEVPRITAEIDAHALLFGNHDLVFRTVTVHGGWVRLVETLEPYPLHDWDKVIVSLVSAFYPRMKPGFRAGIFASAPPPIFELRDINLRDVDLEGYFTPYGTPEAPAFMSTLAVEDVNADGVYFYADGRDPVVARLYFSLAPDPGRPVRGGKTILKIGNRGGSARDDGSGSYDYRIDFKALVIDRLAQLPRGWPDAAVANTLELDARLESTVGGRIRLRGQLIDYWDRPYDGRWDLELTADNMGPTLNTAIDSTMSGDDVRARLTMAGPFIATPKVGFELWGLHVKTPLREATEPLHLILDELHGSIDTINDQGFLEKTVARVDAGQVARGLEPGELELAASFGISPYHVNADLSVKKPIDLGRWLPPVVAGALGQHVMGHLRGHGDLADGFAITELDIALGRRPRERTTRVHGGSITTQSSLDKIQIDNVLVEAGATKLKLLGGVTTSEETLGLLVTGTSQDLGQWLRRLELPTFATRVDGLRVDLDGPWTNLRVKEGSGRLAGTQAGTIDADFRYEDCVLYVDSAVTHDLGGTLRTSGFQVRMPCATPAKKPKRADAGAVDGAGARTGGLDPGPAAPGGAVPVGASVAVAAPYFAMVPLLLPVVPVTPASVAPAPAPPASVAPASVAPASPAPPASVAAPDAGAAPGPAALAAALVPWFAAGSPQAVGLSGTVSGEDLDAAKVLKALQQPPYARGKIKRLDLRINGSLSGHKDPFDQLRLLKGYLVSDKLQIEGEDFRDLAACINYKDDELCRRPGVVVRAEDVRACDDAKLAKGSCVVGRAVHATGGAIDLTLSTPPRRGKDDPALTGTVALSAVPIEALARSLGLAPGTVDGVLSTVLHISGSRTKPTLDGRLTIERLTVLRQLLGTLELSIRPGTGAQRDRLVLRGSTLHDRLELEATIGTSAPYPVDLRLRGRLLELDPLIDLSALLGVDVPVRAWASGTVEVHAELGSDRPPVAWVTLDDLTAIVDRVDDDGAPQPLRVVALPATGRAAVSLRVTPTSVELVCPGDGGGTTPCPIRLATPLGVIEVSGTASAGKLALAAQGVLDLSLIKPLLRGQFDDLSGAAELSAQLTGTALTPQVSAELGLRDVRLRPSGQETVIRVPTGQIKLGQNSLGFSDVRIRVDDTYLDERAELVVRGGIGLVGLTPATWGLIIEGQIAGKMLLALAPSEFSQASGVAEIEDNLTLSGRGARPEVFGTLRFSPVQPLAFVPRKWPRELAFRGGAVTLSDAGTAANRRYQVDIDDVTVAIDGEGSLRRLRGAVELGDGFALAGADLRFDAAAIPFRVPRQLDLVLSATGMRVVKAPTSTAWRLSGGLELVSGRYFRAFDVGELLRPAAASGGSGKPFWEEYPTLAATDLDLVVDVRQFAATNNVFNIDTRGKVRVTGSPRDPRIDGEIRVTRGSFKLPFSPVRFTRTSGTATFSDQRRFPADTPTLAVRSEADYRDRTGQAHLVTVEVTGSIDNLRWDMFTSTGLDKAQTLALLVGQTPDQLRGASADTSLVNPTEIDPQLQSTSLTDQVLKDFVADQTAALFGKQLTELSSLDVVKPYLTTDGFGVHLEERVFENFDLIGDWEQAGGRGTTFNVRGDFPLPYRFLRNGEPLALQGSYLGKNFSDPAEQDISDLQVKLVYRFFIP
ncbi:MAG: translocation/assembly module TamB domain-containing protein [Kofleriaceae bacterium]|nr:translocation/assembly module TamB domain-containing protein [Kofleriaceae bacterium]MBP6836224.1 translocation/assembly module TamB domain-containing protein [Kofleriaceae bacterium]